MIAMRHLNPLTLLDRVTEPDKPYTMYFVLVCAVVCYAAGFLVDNSMFFGAWGCGFLLMPMSEDYFKRRAERRLAAHRRQMAEWERQMRLRMRVRQACDIIVPDWML